MRPQGLAHGREKGLRPEGAHGKKAQQLPVAGKTADEIAQLLMTDLFTRQPAIEGDLLRFAAGQ